MTGTLPETGTRSRLALITQITPAVWPVITSPGIAGSHVDRVALNPQPLPPIEAFQLAAAAMTQEFARLAIQSDIQGRSGAQIISDMVDDWCLTGWPRKWPIPIPGPVHPEPGPRPNEAGLSPSLAQTGRLVGALVLANLGSRLASSELSEAMLRGSERLEARQ
jgi:hypothetical protein